MLSESTLNQTKMHFSDSPEISLERHIKPGDKIKQGKDRMANYKIVISIFCIAVALVVSLIAYGLYCKKNIS